MKVPLELDRTLQCLLQEVGKHFGGAGGPRPGVGEVVKCGSHDVEHGWFVHKSPALRVVVMRHAESAS